MQNISEYKRILHALCEGKNPFIQEISCFGGIDHATDFLDDPHCVRALFLAKNTLEKKYHSPIENVIPKGVDSSIHQTFTVDEALKEFKTSRLRTPKSKEVFEIICNSPNGISLSDLISYSGYNRDAILGILGSINYQWRLYIKNPKSRSYEKKGSRYFRLTSKRFEKDTTVIINDY